MDRFEIAKIRFQVVTPLFIGSGEEYTQEEYWIEGGYLHFLSPEEVVAAAERSGLYWEFVEAAGDFYRLKNFYRTLFQRVTVEEVSWGKLKGPPPLLEQLNRNPTRAVQRFIKNRFKREPIIPGSSLKGAIRTALLNFLIEQFQFPESLGRGRGAGKRVEAYFFCNSRDGRLNPQRDVLKALHISDLIPVEHNYRLELMEPINRPYRKERDNRIPVPIEGLVAGEFEGEIRIDRGLLSRDRNLRENYYFKKFPLSLELIKTTLYQFYSKILERENRRFGVAPLSYSNYLVKIGRFAGAGSKSVENYRQVYIRQLRKSFDYQLSVWIAPDQRPFGWGKVVFE